MKGFVKNMLFLIGGLTTGLIVGMAVNESMKGGKEKLAVQKLSEFYVVLLQWLKVHQEDRSLEAYFMKNGYRSIAIYGMKELGEALLWELENSSIEVKYAIDRDANTLYVPIDIYTPEENLERVDAVVVTAIHYFKEIEAALSEKMDCPIISLEDVVREA